MDASSPQDSKHTFNPAEEDEFDNSHSPLPHVCRHDIDAMNPDIVNVRGMVWSMNKLENISVGLTAFALIASVCITATSGNTLSNYHSSTSGADVGLPLWPQDFTIRPTVALVACGAVSMFFSFVSLYATAVCNYHSKLRARPMIVSGTIYTCALIALGVSVVSIAVFYHADASDTTWTLQSWSCQWKDVEMSGPPHWDTLCSESKGALYLSILMIPVELLSLAGIAFGVKQRELQRQAAKLEEQLAVEKLNISS